VQHGQCHRQQLVGADLQELVARVGLEDVEQFLAGVAVRGHARAGDDLAHPSAHQRHVEDAARVRGGREQAHEPVLPRGAAAVGRDADRDQVQPGPAVHRRAGVGLRDRDQVLMRRPRGLRQHEGRLAHVGVAAQDAEAGAGDGAGGGLAADGDEIHVAGAEEDEVAVGQPAQQRCGLRGVVGRVRSGSGGRAVSREGVEPAGQLQHAAPQPLGVLVHGAHVVQDGAQTDHQVSGGLVVERTVDDDGHPRLGERVGAAARDIEAVAERLDPAGEVTADDDDRMHDVGQVDALPDDLRGDGVDEEGHVVGDQPDDGPAVLETVHVDRGRAGRAHLGQPQVPDREPGELRGIVAEDLRGGLAPVVALQEGGQVVDGAAGGEAGLLPELGRGRLRGAHQQPSLLVAGGLERGELGQSAADGGAVLSARRDRRRHGGTGHVRPRYCEGRVPSRRLGGRYRPVPGGRLSGPGSGRRPSPRSPG
jgi:hypothetical protein